MAGQGTVALRRQLGPLGIVFQRWQKVGPDERAATVSSFGAVPIASLDDGDAAISIREDESVWIGFEGSETHACAARVLGQGTVSIDAVTGRPPTETLDPAAQNYIVVPPQYAITGRTTSPGCARQFVRVASGPHQEAITQFQLIVYASTAERTAPRTDRQRVVRAVGPARPRRASVPSCELLGHVAQLIQEDPFDAGAWDTTRAWHLRVEVLAADEYQRRTGQTPLPPADRGAAYGSWRLP